LPAVRLKDSLKACGTNSTALSASLAQSQASLKAKTSQALQQLTQIQVRTQLGIVQLSRPVKTGVPERLPGAHSAAAHGCFTPTPLSASPRSLHYSLTRQAKDTDLAKLQKDLDAAKAAQVST
jgi:hypothetical protein